MKLSSPGLCSQRTSKFSREFCRRKVRINMKVLVVFIVLAVAASQAAVIAYRDQLSDEDALLLHAIELGRRQGTLSGSYDHNYGNPLVGVGYEHKWNDGRTSLGGTAQFGGGQSPTFGVKFSHQFGRRGEIPEQS